MIATPGSVVWGRERHNIHRRPGASPTEPVPSDFHSHSYGAARFHPQYDTSVHTMPHPNRLPLPCSQASERTPCAYPPVFSQSTHTEFLSSFGDAEMGSKAVLESHCTPCARGSGEEAARERGAALCAPLPELPRLPRSSLHVELLNLPAPPREPKSARIDDLTALSHQSWRGEQVRGASPTKAKLGKRPLLGLRKACLCASCTLQALCCALVLLLLFLQLSFLFPQEHTQYSTPPQGPPPVLPPPPSPPSAPLPSAPPHPHPPHPPPSPAPSSPAPSPPPMPPSPTVPPFAPGTHLIPPLALLLFVLLHLPLVPFLLPSSVVETDQAYMRLEDQYYLLASLLSPLAAMLLCAVCIRCSRGMPSLKSWAPLKGIGICKDSSACKPSPGDGLVVSISPSSTRSPKLNMESSRATSLVQSCRSPTSWRSCRLPKSWHSAHPSHMSPKPSTPLAEQYDRQIFRARGQKTPTCSMEDNLSSSRKKDLEEKLSSDRCTVVKDESSSARYRIADESPFARGKAVDDDLSSSRCKDVQPGKQPEDPPAPSAWSAAKGKDEAVRRPRVHNCPRPPPLDASSSGRYHGVMRKPEVPRWGGSSSRSSSRGLFLPAKDRGMSSAEDLLSSEQRWMATKLRADYHKMMSAGVSSELRRALTNQYLCWFLTNRGLPNDGLTPNAGAVRGLAKLIGLTPKEVITYPGGAKVVVELKRLLPSSYYDPRDLLDSYAEFDWHLEQLTKKQIRFFLSTLAGYFGVSTLRLLQPAVGPTDVLCKPSSDRRVPSPPLSRAPLVKGSDASAHIGCCGNRNVEDMDQPPSAFFCSEENYRHCNRSLSPQSCACDRSNSHLNTRHEQRSPCTASHSSRSAQSKSHSLRCDSVLHPCQSSYVSDKVYSSTPQPDLTA